MNSVIQTEVVKVNGTAAQCPDLLAVEEPLEIRLGYGPSAHRQQRSISVTMRTPGHDHELALGFLFTEGIISAFTEVESIHYCQDAGRQQQENVLRVELSPAVKVDLRRLQRNFYTTSSCGVCGKASIAALKTLCAQPLTEQFTLSEEVIHAAPRTLRASQLVFEYTGGLHAAGLFDTEGKLLLWREDIGRHNALDKLLGACISGQQLPLKQTFLLLSGRVSFELVQKAIMAGIAVIAAVGAPSSLAVDLAQQYGITLLGFVRDQRFNIYCGHQRINVVKNILNKKYHV